MITHHYTTSRVILLAGLLMSVMHACRASRDQQGTQQAETASTETTTQPSSMSGSSMNMPSSTGSSAALMERMRKHLQILHAALADSVPALLPTHRQMVANMIATFNTEMRSMNMPGDAAWNATVDSLRADLINMPSMRGAEFQTFLPAHTQRITHLMQMHHDMMATMKM